MMPVFNPKKNDDKKRDGTPAKNTSASHERFTMKSIRQEKSECKPKNNYARIFEEFGTTFISNGNPVELRAESCPFCDGSKFYLNVETGQYDCKSGSCGQRGNITNYLTWIHREFLRRTTSDQRSLLGKKRGIAPQTLDRHQLAFDSDQDRWLIPFKSSNGNVVNIQFYYWNRPKPNKFNLPGLPTSIYNFHTLGKDASKHVFLCEGPFDAISLDYAIGAKHRSKYIIVATPGGFKDSWAEHFQGRTVRTLFDNDQGGDQHRKKVEKLLMGDGRIADELRVLKWPNEGMDDIKDINDFVRRYSNVSILKWIEKNSYKVNPNCKLAWSFGWEGEPGQEHIDWPWENHIRCGSYCSFSGKGGTFKSTIMRELVARYTQGLAMPGQSLPSMPPGFCIYLYAEETEAAVRGKLLDAGADMNKIILLPAFLKDGDPLNVLDQLDDLKEMVRRYKVRLLVIDGQNSVVGAPCIATDMLARHNVTNKLHQFAQRENIALVGIRNEDSLGRALGPQSMGDIARCIMRTEPILDREDGHYFLLRFPKVSDVPKCLYPDIPYAVEDCPGSPPRILWGKSVSAHTEGGGDVEGNPTVKISQKESERIVERIRQGIQSRPKTRPDPYMAAALRREFD